MEPFDTKQTDAGCQRLYEGENIQEFSTLEIDVTIRIFVKFPSQDFSLYLV